MVHAIRPIFAVLHVVWCIVVCCMSHSWHVHMFWMDVLGWGWVGYQAYPMTVGLYRRVWRMWRRELTVTVCKHVHEHVLGIYQVANVGLERWLVGRTANCLPHRTPNTHGLPHAISIADEMSCPRRCRWSLRRCRWCVMPSAMGVRHAVGDADGVSCHRRWV